MGSFYYHGLLALVGVHLPDQSLKFLHASLPSSGKHREVGGCHYFRGQPQSIRAPDSPATTVLHGAHARAKGSKELRNPEKPLLEETHNCEGRWSQPAALQLETGR